MGESMKKKIFWRLILIGLLSLFFSSAMFLTMFTLVFKGRVEDEIAVIADIVTAAYNENVQTEVLPAIESRGIRVTLMDSDGEILFENVQDKNIADNYPDSGEISEITVKGRSVSSIVSDRTGVKTYYCTCLAENGNIVQVAIDANVAFYAIKGVLPVMISTGVLILIISVLLANMLTKALVNPIVAMADDLDNIEKKVPYPELKPFADSIAASQKQTRENERIRQEFTANVSHELKTPLTSISGYAEMIENGMARYEDIQEFAGKIHNESGRLIQLIHDIIKLSELEEPEEVLFEEVDLFGVAEDTVHLLSLNAANAGITLRMLGNRQMVQGNRSMLEELVYNLCDNGIRYNCAGGKVTIRVFDIKGNPAIEVSDTGIGIPEEHLGRIFERFYRADKSRSKATGGTGLGLAIVKHIAIRHRAEIKVESNVGIGTNITVVFPSIR